MLEQLLLATREDLLRVKFELQDARRRLELLENPPADAYPWPKEPSTTLPGLNDVPPKLHFGAPRRAPDVVPTAPARETERTATLL